MWNSIQRLISPWKGSAATHSAVIYSRTGCHLCDEAEEVLLRHGLLPETVDIDADSALRERYTNCVPVVLIDGRERFRGRVNEVLLRRLLRARPAPPRDVDGSGVQSGPRECPK